MDELDKDVTNAIYYAVDNGAKVINMSIGKSFSPQKQLVDEAFKYAEKKGVLLIHSAGNRANNIDSIPHYPTPFYADNGKASNMITVGASSSDSSWVCGFSNYGKETVDVFAPGEFIYSTTRHEGYTKGDGTSFSTPIVSGLAALIWSYYPNLSYKQVKYCIETSATPRPQIVTKPGTTNKVPFSTLSKTGGIINAYRAMEIAEKL